ncbi:MAG: hypothetical protein JGK24_25885 [Microcoleus sp. PH2017_29_MFU_D_A]|uniref:hypothetical protein n=1 Tax=unclassified Microcoleus TaxID=2642155 RepID=UPI001D894598|nr:MULTISPECIES: hypothetical protein [unclassified Microcoleus]MCC3418639.1 hypothetical protein [Microcoleus sp. PH2017_07_MST_O_A]MCC3513139.1 hypothetical protein [Microcoleus sp. PH2017_17_BER_D_A]TAG63642.1 MAG: hypothetical protein EAZ25_23690 [Oscillatoriales cyanobacterium]MCC3427123.1 hypothetical protein [Microcoleus sp. PH2017_01_SCD_O_A]MCC3606559.1 hypothetical protein [Microcoleus sp. PH2017_29_MFU_D_A]
MLKLVDPTLNLFSYTLKQGLGVGEPETRKVYRKFLDALAEQLHQQLNVSFTPEQKQKFLALQEKAVADLPFTGNLNNHSVKGSYRRWNLSDNYQILFNGYVEDKYEPDKVIKLIESLQYLIPKPPQLENIGKTWMLSGWLESGDDAEKEELAKQVYKCLFAKDGVPQGSGEFLGGKVFEFWGDKIEDNCQLLVILYPDEVAFKTWAREFLINGLDLLCFRHKIIWAYEKSLVLKDRLVSNYNQIVEMRNTSRLNLQKLMDAMGKLSEFAIDLNYLELQYSTIKVNLEKYEAKLAEIKAQVRPSDDLQFLQDFLDKAKQHYPKQIQKDIDNFRPCLEILRSLTDTIRGTVEIRKAESDRTFQNIVGIVGVGLSTGGTVASASANYKTEIEANPAINGAINTLFPLFEPGSGLRIIMGFTILSGVAASLLTAIIIVVWPRIFRR